MICLLQTIDLKESTFSTRSVNILELILLRILPVVNQPIDLNININNKQNYNIKLKVRFFKEWVHILKFIIKVIQQKFYKINF
jgi:hypothetical protein